MRKLKIIGWKFSVRVHCTLTLKCTLPRGRQRDVVYLGWPMTNNVNIYEKQTSRKSRKCGCALCRLFYGSVRSKAESEWAWSTNPAFTFISSSLLSRSIPTNLSLTYTRQLREHTSKLCSFFYPFSRPDLLASLCHVWENISVQSRFDLLYLIGFKILNLRN